MIETLLKTKNYKVGLYIRLSKEDIDKYRDVSLSVENQIMALENYVKENKYELYNKYIDDGYTGTNFNRPGFKRMIEDIEQGKINMVVTKDLSRLGRDYIETGEYIEKYFPMKKVRYVALLDGIDTMLDSSNNDIAPFKAVINDMYSRDNSKKIRTALKTMQMKGKWVGGCTPLGYMSDPNDKNHLIINEDEAYIVRKIFSLAHSGMTYCQITDYLISNKIPTASMLRNKSNNSYMASSGIWSTKTVRNILENRLYVGDLVQNKKSRISYKIRKMVDVPKDRWIIIENTHAPIIDKYVFNEVQEMLKNCKVRPKKEVYRLLDGLLFCGDCNHRLSILKPRSKNGKSYVVCNYYRRTSKLKLCTSHYFNYEEIEKIVLEKLKEIFLSLDKNKIIEKTKKEIDKEINKIDYESKLNNIKNQIDNKNKQLDKMYLDKLDKKIDEAMYDRIFIKINDEIEKLKEEEKDIKERIKNNEFSKINDKIEKLIKEFLNLEYPSRSLMLRLIKNIKIYNNKNIDIHFNFNKLNFLLGEECSTFK